MKLMTISEINESLAVSKTMENDHFHPSHRRSSVRPFDVSFFVSILRFSIFCLLLKMLVEQIAVEDKNEPD